ncbi:hypothetical protein D3C73_1216540 [compost metagenome]
MGHHRHHAGNVAVLGHGLGNEDCQMGVARKIAGAADAVHHVRAADMRGIHVAVDIEFQRRIDRDDAQATDDFRRIADFLRTQHDAFAVMLHVGQDLVVDRFGHGNGRGRRERKLALVQQFDGAVLQHFGIHRQRVEV